MGITRDFLDSNGNVTVGDIGLEILDQVAGSVWEFLPERSDETTVPGHPSTI